MSNYRKRTNTEGDDRGYCPEIRKNSITRFNSLFNKEICTIKRVSQDVRLDRSHRPQNVWQEC
jgi:hypothetical protein